MPEMEIALATLTTLTQELALEGLADPLDSPVAGFPNLLSQFVYTRTYSRWIEELGRRETWRETVDRYVEFISTERDLPIQVVADIRAMVGRMEVLPSMRALWSAGPAARRDNTCMYNCFGGNEKFVTPEGLLTFKEAVGRNVTVRTLDGRWMPATVQSFGRQPLQTVTFGHWNGGKHGNETHTVQVTHDHRWLLLDGTETTALKVGDKLAAPPLALDDNLIDEEAVRHGFVFGDGTINRSAGREYAQVRLCGKKARLLNTVFAGFKSSNPPSYGGDPMVYLGKDNVHWKCLPETTNPGYVAGFIKGLFLADGCGTTTSGNLRISTQDARLVAWFCENAALAGYKVLSDQLYDGDTNFDKRAATLHMVLLGTGNAAIFRVEGIKNAGVEEEVFCVVEPETKTFMLANGQVTGNCAFVPLDSMKSFSELLYILMMGTGIGYSVERKFTSNLPEVGLFTGEAIPHVVPDSTNGWADSFQFGLTQWFQGHKVAFDYSKVRKAGAPLKTKGGRASGPAPLRRLFEFCEETILAASGRQLKSIECHDIACMVGEIVMSGGVRRAALISMSDVDDEEMRHAKDWSRGSFPTLRYMSNNSAHYPEKPDEETFQREWDALVASKSGERGLFSIPSVKAAARRGDCRPNPCVTGDTRVMTEGGLVQIQDLVKMAGDSGYKVAIDRRFNEGVWATTHSETGTYAFKSGTKEVFILQTSEGYSVRLTANHRVMTSDGWKEAQHLVAGDVIHIVNTEGMFGTQGNADAGMLAGWVTGDGCLLVDQDGDGCLLVDQDNTPRLYFYGADHHLVDQMLDAAERLTGSRPNIQTYEPNDLKCFQQAALRGHLGQVIEDKFRVPEFVWQGTEDCQRSYLSALFSADGSVGDNREKGAHVRLHSSKVNLLRDVQTLLLNFGIACRIYEERRPAGYRDLPDGKGGYKTYWCEADHDLHISKANMVKFHERIGFIHQDKQAKLAHEVESRMVLVGVKGASGRPGRGFYKETFTTRFENLVSDGVEDVYDMTVPVTHSFVANGLVVHNCGEIMLRYLMALQSPEGATKGTGGSGQFCNLSAAIMRSHDTVESFSEKVRVATWIGAIQATFTHFPYLREGWAQTCIEDRLLGVDITGQCDNPGLSQNEEAMLHFNQVAIEAAAEASAYLGINMPVAITCGKPSGNSSQLVDCASGFHARYAPYYIRRVRIASTDPLFKLIRDAGVPCHKDNQFVDWKDEDVPTWVVEFPVKAPTGSVFRNDETAIQMLERYLLVMKTWCGNRGHNQSVTIYVKDDEWDMVGKWVFEHFDEITGISFLPFDGGSYKLAPYEEIDEDTYKQWMSWFPEVDFDDLTQYEKEDRGQGAVELACSGGSCSIDYDAISMEMGRVDSPVIETK